MKGTHHRPRLMNLVALGALLFHLLPQQALAITPIPMQRSLNQLPPAASQDPLALALAYLDTHAAQLGLTEADLADLVVKDRYVSQHNGVTHLYLRQRFQGIDLATGDLAIAINSDGRVLHVGNRFLGGIAARIKPGPITIDAEHAVEAGANALGLTLTERLMPYVQAQGAAQAQLLSDGGLSADPIPVQLVYQLLPDGKLALSWEVILRLPAREEWLSLRVDSATSELRATVDWVNHWQAAPPPGPPPGPLTSPPPSSYLVYGLPAESPLAAERTLLVNPADPLASPFGWHTTSSLAGTVYTTTWGNNSFTYADLVAPDGYGPGDYLPQVGSTLLFSATADLTQSPATYRDAALTNLFYVTNAVHDLLYHYGFDEAAGNFQKVNYTGQGLGNDSVRTEGQDYRSSGNASFATPPDGQAPIMQIGLGLVPGGDGTGVPRRDGALDNGVIIHEYGHGLSNRLTGGPANSGCLATQEAVALGEGWSDFLALVLTAQPQDRPTTKRVIGRWLAGQGADGSGVRHYPYSTDWAVNPLTFGATTRLDPVTGYPADGHTLGEVWATILWELYWQLVGQAGFDPNLATGNGGNQVALQLVIDGLKLQPCNPTFVEARDAILAADQANHAGANQCLIWAAFARRGLGYQAQAGNSSSVTDGVEAFDLPSSCTLALTPPTQTLCQSSPATYTITSGAALTETVTLSVTAAPSATQQTLSTTTLAPLREGTLTVRNTGTAPGWYGLAVTGVSATKRYTATAELHVATAPPPPPPLTIPPTGATDLTTTPSFAWAASGAVAAYGLELAADPLFANQIYSTTVATATATLPFPLQPGQAYWWRVTAHNGCGQAVSPPAMFRVAAQPRVLLVDDDSSSGIDDVNAYYREALDQRNIGYDQWYTGHGRAEPTQLAQLAAYPTLIWFTGHKGQSPSPATEALLADYLAGGRCLLISAQEYYRYAGLTPFMQSYLGAAAVAEDGGNGHGQQQVISGITGPFAGLGPYRLTFHGVNATDSLTPTSGAQVAFVGDGGNAALYYDGGHFRSSYWGFGFESLPTAQARAQVMGRLLDWCAFQSDLAVTQQITPPGLLQPGQPFTYTLSYTNLGVTTTTNSLLTANFPREWQGIEQSRQEGLTVDWDNQEIAWQLGCVAPNATGLLTVTGVVSSTLSTPRALTFTATITGSAYDRTSVNNQGVIARTVIVPQVALAATSYRARESTPTLTVLLTVDQPNPFAPVVVDYLTSDGSAQASSDYGAIAGSATIAPGQVTTTVTIGINNDQTVEGEETFSLQLSNPRGATLGAARQATVTLGDDDQPPLPSPPSQLAVSSMPPTGSILVVGTLITYTAVVTNQSTLTQPVTITATLGTGLRYQPETIAPPAGHVDGEMLRWHFSAVPPGLPITVHVVAQLAPPEETKAEVVATHFRAAVGAEQLSPLLPVTHQIQPPESVRFRLYLPLIQQ